jgi:hypothetical protein
MIERIEGCDESNIIAEHSIVMTISEQRLPALSLQNRTSTFKLFQGQDTISGSRYMHVIFAIDTENAIPSNIKFFE